MGSVTKLKKLNLAQVVRIESTSFSFTSGSTANMVADEKLALWVHLGNSGWI